MTELMLSATARRWSCPRWYFWTLRSRSNARRLQIGSTWKGGLVVDHGNVPGRVVIEKVIFLTLAKYRSWCTYFTHGRRVSPNNAQRVVLGAPQVPKCNRSIATASNEDVRLSRVLVQACGADEIDRKVAHFARLLILAPQIPKFNLSPVVGSNDGILFQKEASVVTAATVGVCENADRLLPLRIDLRHSSVGSGRHHVLSRTAKTVARRVEVTPKPDLFQAVSGVVLSSANTKEGNVAIWRCWRYNVLRKEEQLVYISAAKTKARHFFRHRNLSLVFIALVHVIVPAPGDTVPRPQCNFVVLSNRTEQEELKYHWHWH